MCQTPISEGNGLSPRAMIVLLAFPAMLCLTVPYAFALALFLFNTRVIRNPQGRCLV